LSAGSTPTRVSEPLANVSRGELSEQAPLDERRLRRRVLVLIGVIALIVAVITLVPGLASLRDRFANAQWEWLLVGAALKLLSGVAYVVVFRGVFCPRMSWRLSGEIGFSELGANAVIPTGGAGGLALGIWALRRTGMPAERVARRSVAFFFLTSVPNVLGVIVLGVAMAVGLFASAPLTLTLVPALIALAAVAITIFGGRWAERRASVSAERRGESARLPRVLAALAGGVQEALAMLLHPDRWLVVGLLGYLGFDVMVLWATFHAFGASPPLAIIWMGYLIGELGGLIPIPGGIGGVDLGLVGMLVLYKVPVTEATAAVLAYRALALWIPAVMGAVAFALLRRTLAQESTRIECCEPGGEVEVIGRGRVRLTA
jgi:uncharacterized protein (TIRG00374 family)